MGDEYDLGFNSQEEQEADGLLYNAAERYMSFEDKLEDIAKAGMQDAENRLGKIGDQLLGFADNSLTLGNNQFPDNVVGGLDRIPDVPPVGDDFPPVGPDCNARDNPPQILTAYEVCKENGSKDLYIEWVNPISYNECWLGFHINPRQIPLDPSAGTKTLLYEGWFTTQDNVVSVIGECLPRLLPSGNTNSGFDSYEVPVKTCQPGQPDEPQPEPPEEPTEEPEEPEEPDCQVCGCNPCGCQPPTEPSDPKNEPHGIWQKQSSGICYVQSMATGPEDDSDELLTSFPTRRDAERNIDRYCPDEPSDEPSDEPRPGPSFTSSDILCNLESIVASANANEGKDGLLQGVLQFANGWGKVTKDIREFEKDITAWTAWSGFPFAPLASVVSSITQLMGAGFDFTSLLCGKGDQLFNAKVAQAALGAAETWLGADLSQAQAPLTYYANALCPYRLQSTGESISSYLSGQIDETQLDNYLRINGNCPEDLESYIRGQRTKLAPGQLVQATYRGLIERDRFDREVRESGFLQDESRILFDLGKYLAPPTDLIRFMVRDVEDDVNVVTPFGLDDAFEDKFRGLTKEVAEKQGVDEATMRRYWRAHWDIPSPTQLYEMYHRLRNHKNEDLRVDRETVKTALQQQDILPFWIDRFLEVSFNPLTRVDTRRAYDLGDITPEQVRESYEAQGYDDKNVDILTRYSTTLKNEGIDSQKPIKYYLDYYITAEACEDELRRREFDDDIIRAAMFRAFERRRRTVHTLRPYKQFEDGIIDEAMLRDELRQRLLSDSEINFAVDQAKRELSAKFRRDCQKAIEYRFQTGEIDRGEAAQELRDIGTPATYADELADQMACRLVYTEKHGALRTFREMLEYGTATPAEILERLRKMRYTDEVARDMVAAMSERLRLREEKEAAREQRRIKSEQKKQEREERRKQEATQRQVERGIKLAQKAKQAREKRAVQVQAAITKFVDKFGTDHETTAARVANIGEIIKGTSGFAPTRIHEATIKVIEHAIKTENESLESIVNEVVNNMAEWLDDVE